MFGCLIVNIVLQAIFSDQLKDMKKDKLQARMNNLKHVACVMNVVSRLKLVYLRRAMNYHNVPSARMRLTQILCSRVKNRKDQPLKIF